MDHDKPTRRHRALHEVGGIIADGAYASLLAIPVAVGVAAYTFVYLSFLRRRLQRRANHTAEEHVPPAVHRHDH